MGESLYVYREAGRRIAAAGDWWSLSWDPENILFEEKFGWGDWKREEFVERNCKS
jgi:hypothetical protein